MFDKLIEVLVAIWDDIKPIVIVKHYEQAVRLRFGKYIGNWGPGTYFRWPGFTDVIIHYAKDDTILLPSQKLTTKDGKTITTRGIILYYIDDIRLFLTEVNAAQQAISDMAMGVIASTVVSSNYEDCYNDKVMNEISKDVRREAKKWGAYIVYVKLTDISSSKTFNIFKENEAHL